MHIIYEHVLFYNQKKYIYLKRQRLFRTSLQDDIQSMNQNMLDNSVDLYELIQLFYLSVHILYLVHKYNMLKLHKKSCRRSDTLHLQHFFDLSSGSIGQKFVVNSCQFPETTTASFVFTNHPSNNLGQNFAQKLHQLTPRLSKDYKQKFSNHLSKFFYCTELQIITEGRP